MTKSWAALWLVALAACGTASERPRPDGGSQPAPDGYAGPPISVDVMQMESWPVQWAAVARVTAPTGGWKFALDRSEHAGGVLDLWTTLERPGVTEFVTQATQEHTVRKGTGTGRIDSVRVHVRLTRRGENAVDEYGLAATSH